MLKWLLIVLGVVLLGAGIVWTLQGLAILPGSVMSGVTFWAIVGPIVAVVGLGAAHPRHPPQEARLSG